jgi:N-succinyldiaminopimelate aminotransferase
LCVKHDLIAVCDEVYEHIVFDDQPHIPLASLPGMRERSLCISSLAKTFSVTGWKVGWACGPSLLIEALLRAKQFVTYCGAAPLQMAGAVALQTPADFYQQLAQDYQQKRDFLFDQFARLGWQVLPCQGTYYLMVDIGAVRQGSDVEFCHWLVERIGVAAIPASPFYADPQDGAQLVRFAFCKSPAVLEEAVKRLKTRL